ncbi:MAG: Maf family protein [Hyphomicrobiaceae bacterium]
MLDATIVLASASRTRRQMLEAAGLHVRVEASGVDEDAVRAALGRQGLVDPAIVAEKLACAKAEQVGLRYPALPTVGADQVLALGARLFVKPNDLAEARRTLEALSGRTHDLHSAVALAEGGKITWTCVATARLTMRALSTDVIETYLARAGADVCRSVGAYEIEGLGIQLFERIEGNYFTILGLPLLPLLTKLRTLVGGR